MWHGSGLGIGKLPGPARAGAKQWEDDDAGGTGDSGQPLTITEIVAELLNANKPLAEVAGYDDVQMRWLLFRERDRWGQLMRVDKDLPPWVHVDEDGMRIVKNPTPFEKMYKQVRQYQRWTPENIEDDWLDFKRHNPKMGVSE